MSQPPRQLRIGVDIGGTFTDLCVMDESGIVAVGKVLTTSREPALAVEQVIRETLAANALSAGDVGRFIHGTTLVTNAIIERKGARTALLATAGFRDVLELAREHRYELYDLMIEMPVPLVPRWLRFDVPERVYADGTVAEALDVGFVEKLAAELVDAGVEAVAIAFLHSFTNPRHEQEARAAIHRVAPQLRVAISSEVVPEIREFERTSTTVANVYVQGLTEEYLADLRIRVADVGVPGEPRIMLSNGGIATIDTAARFPIRMLESGPAGGALAAAAFGAHGDQRDLLAFDMGGTTAKLCIIEDGEPLVTHQFEVDRVYRMRPGSGLPVKVPVIDMIEIGVGGGSIARINALGLLTVGPHSAGSEPGPVCYGRGGTLPTVTDADLVLGYLDPAYFLGGRMVLDVEAARAAIAMHIADPLGVDVAEAAWGIHRTANEDMANAARVHAVERGKDPTGLPLFTFGGAGPVHGAGVAAALRAGRVIAPPAAGVMSAVGFLTAPLSFDFVRSAHMIVDDLVDKISAKNVEALFADMETEAQMLLERSGVGAADVHHRRFAEMRYSGQGFEVRVPVPSSVAGADWRTALSDAFSAQYARLYERQGPTVPLEVLSWRVVSTGPTPTAELRARVSTDAAASRKENRRAYFPAVGYVETAVYDRYAMAVNEKVSGPAIVEERECTLVVPPGATCSMIEDGSLVMELPVASAPAVHGLDPFVIGVVANRLVATLQEQQSTLVNTAFSSVVRESLDLACAVFDSKGEMVAQSIGGTPGHINAMATGMHHVVAAFPSHTLTAGDVLLTNDPWKTSGQINDITVATPVFAGDRLVAWFATCCHAPDIGGRIVSAEAKDVFEEGLRLPIMKMFKAGVANEELFAIIRANVRTPGETVGDLYAQMSANEVGAHSLLRLLDEFGLPDIDGVAEQIMKRSERAIRDALSAMDDGSYEAEMRTDGYGDDDLVLHAKVTIAGDEIFVDYTGSSPQSLYGINVVANYTRAYASFAVKAAIAPDVPHNAGSFRPVHVSAPLGSVLNCVEPAPVAVRHLVGHFLPSLLFRALRPAMPGRLLADSSDALWMTIWNGVRPGHESFTFTAFQAGGTGARAVKDGISATSFPSGVRAVPTEVIETVTPLMQQRRELRVDSGGAGRERGGLGQFTRMACRTGEAWSVNGNVDRVRHAASGAEGGGDGAPGGFTSAGGGDLPRKQLHRLQPGDVVCVDLPGGGGYGNAFERDPARVLADVVGGYVSIEAARTTYGVAISDGCDQHALVRPPAAYALDTTDTARLRGVQAVKA